MKSSCKSAPCAARRLAIVAAGLALGACATPYAAKGLLGGFSERRLPGNRFEVEFSGNGYTSAQRVANMYLYRCAELTLQNGFEVFRSRRPDDASPELWSLDEGQAAQPGTAQPGTAQPYRSGGGGVRTIYVPGGAGPALHRMRGIVHMGRYADVPADVEVLDARKVLAVLEPVLQGAGRVAPIATEDIARVALAPGRAAPGRPSGSTSLDDLRLLLPR